MRTTIATAAMVLAFCLSAGADKFETIDVLAKIMASGEVCKPLSEAAQRGLALLARGSGIDMRDNLVVYSATLQVLHFQKHPEEKQGFCATVEEKILPNLERRDR